MKSRRTIEKKIFVKSESHKVFTSGNKLFGTPKSEFIEVTTVAQIR